MTPKKIYGEHPEIKEKVETAYPINEKDCDTKIGKIKKLRWWMAKKLYNEKTAT